MRRNVNPACPSILHLATVTYVVAHYSSIPSNIAKAARVTKKFRLVPDCIPASK